MKQTTLATAGFGLVTKRMRKRVFLDEINLVIPWAELVALITPIRQWLQPKADACHLRLKPCCAFISAAVVWTE